MVVCIHMNVNLDNMDRAQLLELRAEINRRLNNNEPSSTIAERRDYRDGWLQNEYRRNKNGLRGPYWYFYRIVGGQRERVYVGKTEHPEEALEARREP